MRITAPSACGRLRACVHAPALLRGSHSSARALPGRHAVIVNATDAAVQQVQQDVRVPWYDKNLHLFTVVESNQDFEQFLAARDGRYKVMDFYAGWCSSCKSSYPKLCQLISEPDMQRCFSFAKGTVENADVKGQLKSYGVTVIPYLLVFDGNGRKVVGLPASFKKLDLLKSNLHFLASNLGKEVVVDAAGILVLAEEQ